MSNIKNSHYRYNLLDDCFKNKHNPKGFGELLEYLNDKLSAVFDHTIKKRTLRNDIALFRDKEKGFGAPLVTKEFKGKEVYIYDDPDFSIAKLQPLEDEQYILDTAIQLLERYEGNPYYDKLSEALLYLEDKGNTINLEDDKQILFYDKNEAYEGLKLLKPFFMAIKKQKVLAITYQGFFDKKAVKYTFHPQILKQYNQRWFVFGFNQTQSKEKWSIPLDERILDYHYLDNLEWKKSDVNWALHFSQLIGVRNQSITNTENKPETVVLKISDKRIDYFKTKPIHPEWDEFIDENRKNQVFFDCIINHELVQKILSYGEDIEIISPQSLREIVFEKAKQMQLANKIIP